MTAKVDTALALARRGFRVFPLANVKGQWQPAIKKFAERATTDETQIATWWCDSDSRGIAIATGSGLLAVDLDNKNGKRGSDEWAKLDLIEGCPPTLTFKTSSGGEHWLYKADRPVGNGVGKIATGIDHRGDGGYIRVHDHLLAGVDLSAPLAPAPEWLLSRIGRPRDKAANADQAAPGADIDSEYNVSRATDFLKSLEPVVEGERNIRCWQVASDVRSFGISRQTCTALMLENWDCQPMLDADEFETTVNSAYDNAKEPMGVNDPNHDFEAPAVGAPVGIRPAIVRRGLQAPSPVRGLEFMRLQPRPWIIPGVLLRRVVSEIVSHGGVGKTSWLTALAVGIATGREDIAGFPIRERGPVWIYNNEDETNELNLRVAALLQHYGITEKELQDDLGAPLLYVNSGENGPITIAETRNGKIVPKDPDALIHHIRERGIIAAIFDPLIETHDTEENDNNGMRQVLANFRDVAQAADCAALVAHHMRKGNGDDQAGDIDAGRGASSQIGVIRMQSTLVKMTETDAKRFGVASEHRWRYRRFDLGKMNQAPATGAATWFEMLSVPVICGDELATVEHVGVTVPARLEDSKSADARAEHARQFVDLVARLIPAGADRVSISSLASRLCTDAQPDLALGARDTVAKQIARAFALAVEIDGALWVYREGRQPGTNTHRWIVREAQSA